MRRLVPLTLLMFALCPRSARAQDAFEIQVYDAETAPPGDVGTELHVNNFVVGRHEAEPPELPTNHVTHLTLEPHIGVATWCEAGAYIQTAIRGDGNFDFAGIKLRFKMRVPRRVARGLLGLALNFELSHVPVEYEAHRFGSEMRPIIDLRWKRLYVSLNPIVSIDVGGPLAGHPQLEPAAKVAVDIVPGLSVGPEYYAALGPVDSIAPLSQQVHRIFGVLDFQHDFGRVSLSVNAGAGYGLAAGEKWIAKMIIGFDYDRPQGGSRPQAAGPALPSLSRASLLTSMRDGGPTGNRTIDR